jgi:putative hydrolase of the HAD superfamily
MTIRAVLWDMGGVILRTEDSSGRRRWEQRLGLAPGELAKIVFDGEGSRKAVVGRGTEDDIWTWVLGRLGLPESERHALAADFFSGDRMDQRLVGFIRSLRPRVKTGMITNAWPNVRNYLENEWHVADAFDRIVISAEVGLIKPDPRIYRMALEGLGVLPGEAVFVDDMPENITGAEAVGMHGIRFLTPDQAISEVRDLLGSPPPPTA